MDKVTITNADEMITHGIDWNNWTNEPVFDFATEVDALQTLDVLGEQLRAAREHVHQIMRYVEAAVLAARHNGTRPQAIINHGGLARRTIYRMLAENADQ